MGNRRSRELRPEAERQTSWERLRAELWSPDEDLRAFGSGTPRIQIIHLPSFSPGAFWEVCRLREKWLLYTATSVTCGYPEPLKVQGYEIVEFPSEDLRAYFQRLTALALPIAPDLSDRAGVDGTLTRLAIFGDLSSRIRLQWWSTFPPAWTPLVQLTDEMLAAFGGTAKAGDA
jgi:hypothetical protein